LGSAQELGGLTYHRLVGDKIKLTNNTAPLRQSSLQ
jgi:hypothetical protein